MGAPENDLACPHCGAQFKPQSATGGVCPDETQASKLHLDDIPLPAGQVKPERKTDGATNFPTPNEKSDKAPSAVELAPYFPELEILELLGQGGMGMVYKAHQPKLDRLVALKILPNTIGNGPSFAERFSREAKIMARLNHPNIVTIYDFGQSGPFFYLIMEYVDGANLRQIESANRLTPAEALSIVPAICEALQYAHSQGIVHRDIKPANILIDRKGWVKITDFGLGKLLGQEAQDHSLTKSSDVMGTLHYMSPEQYANPNDVDSRADIFSLGVVFYEMLTGELPLGRFEPPSAKVQVDVRLDEVVLRSLERDRERRYQHASELKTKVESLTAKHTPVVTSYYSRAGFLVVVVLLLGIAGWWWMKKNHKPMKPEVVATTVGVSRQPSTNPVPQASQPISVSKHNFAAWPDFVAAYIGSIRVGGYCFVVRDHGKIAASGAGGYARMPWEKEGQGLAWTPDKIMCVRDSGLTAAAIMKLWEEKKFSLDEPFWPYVKDLFPNAHESVRQVTIRHLLTHRTGLAGDFFSLNDAAFVLTQPLTSKPGTVFNNGNGGDNNLLRLVLERISGENYNQYVKKHFLAPAGATKTDQNGEAYLPVLGYDSKFPGRQMPGYSFVKNSKESDLTKDWFSSPADWSALVASLADGRILSANTSRMLFDAVFWGVPVYREDQIIGYCLRRTSKSTAGSNSAGNLQLVAIHFIDGVDAVLFVNSDEGKVSGLLEEAWKLKL